MSDDALPDGAAVRAAALRTLATDTARIARFASFHGPTPDDDDFSGAGVADFARRRVQFPTCFVTKSTLAEKQRLWDFGGPPPLELPILGSTDRNRAS